MTLARHIRGLWLHIRFVLTGRWPHTQINFSSWVRFIGMLNGISNRPIKIRSRLAAQNLLLSHALSHAGRLDEANQFSQLNNQQDITANPMDGLVAMAQAALATNNRKRTRLIMEYRKRIRLVRAETRRQTQAEVRAERMEQRAIVQEQARAAARQRRRERRALLDPDWQLDPKQRKAKRWREHVAEELAANMDALRRARSVNDNSQPAELDSEFGESLRDLRRLKGTPRQVKALPVPIVSVLEDDEALDAETQALLASFEDQLNRDMDNLRAEAENRRKRQAAAQARTRRIAKEREDTANLLQTDIAEQASEAEPAIPEVADNTSDDDDFLQTIESSLTTRLDRTVARPTSPKPSHDLSSLQDAPIPDDEFNAPDFADELDPLAPAPQVRKSTDIREDLMAPIDSDFDLGTADDLLPDLPTARRAAPVDNTQQVGPDRTTKRLRRRVRLPRTQAELRILVIEQLEQGNNERVIELLEGALEQDKMELANLRFWLSCARDGSAHEITAQLLMRGLDFLMSIGRWQRVGDILSSLTNANHPPLHFEDLEEHFYGANTADKLQAVALVGFALGAPEAVTKHLQHPLTVGHARTARLLFAPNSIARNPLVLQLGPAKQEPTIRHYLTKHEIADANIVNLDQLFNGSLPAIADLDEQTQNFASALEHWLAESLFLLEADPGLNRIAPAFGIAMAASLQNGGNALATLRERLTASNHDAIYIWPNHDPRAKVLQQWLNSLDQDMPTELIGVIPQSQNADKPWREPGNRQANLARESFDRFMRGLWTPLPLPDDLNDQSILLCDLNEKPGNDEKIAAVTDAAIAPEYFDNALDWHSTAPRPSDRAYNWLTYLGGNLPPDLWSRLAPSEEMAWTARISTLVPTILSQHLPRAAQLVARAPAEIDLPLSLAETTSPFGLMVNLALSQPAAQQANSPIRNYLNMRHNITKPLAILVPDPKDARAEQLAETLQLAANDSGNLQAAVQFLPNDPRHAHFDKHDHFGGLPVLHHLSMIDSLKAADYVITPLSTTATSCALMGLNVIYLNDASEIERDRQAVFKTVKVVKPRGLRVALRNMAQSITD